MPTDGIHCTSLTWHDGTKCEVGDQVVKDNHEQSGWMIWGCIKVGERKVAMMSPHGIRCWCDPDRFILMFNALDTLARDGKVYNYDINLEPLPNDGRN